MSRAFKRAPTCLCCNLPHYCQIDKRRRRRVSGPFVLRRLYTIQAKRFSKVHIVLWQQSQKKKGKRGLIAITIDLHAQCVYKQLTRQEVWSLNNKNCSFCLLSAPPLYCCVCTVQGILYVMVCAHVLTQKHYMSSSPYSNGGSRRFTPSSHHHHHHHHIVCVREESRERVTA